MRRFTTCLLTLWLLISNIGNAQDPYYAKLDSVFSARSEEIPALEEKISISVTDVSIQEFLRGVARNSGLNIDIDPALDIKIINNFTNVEVQNILLFICQQYNLGVSIMGNIISVYPRKKQQVKRQDGKSILYDEEKNAITIDYSEEDLRLVAKEITRATGKNIILSPGITNFIVSGYIQNMPFDQALDKFAFTNQLQLEITKDNFYVLNQASSKVKQQEALARNQMKKTRSTEKPADEFELDIQKLRGDTISIHALNAPVFEIIQELSLRVGLSYHITTALEGSVTLDINEVQVDDFLAYLFNGTEYTFINEYGIYLIGQIEVHEFVEQRVISLQYRTIDNLSDIFPEDLTQTVEIIEFSDLNSLLVSGTKSNIDKFEAFLKSIDKIVPVIMIEVIIVDVNKSFTVSTGITAGKGEAPVSTQGTVFPGVDLQIGANGVNDVLGSFNGFGSKALGKVTPEFYVTLKAMESQGLLNVRSTPRLSTLNGSEATLSIGNTEYYLEEQRDIIGTQNPQLTTTQNYKPITAQLSITIRPVVSGNDQITLEIDVQQSDFTERISQFAPPGSVSREFKSMIRVKNQEMVLLGGLEESRSNDAGSGLPLLSRIPVIKWFFSSKTNEKSKSKLNIFIRPTIIN